MHFASVRLRNFRNHDDSLIEPGSGINVLVGGNGEGKTNVLEAVSYFGLTKSFFSASDATTLQYGKAEFEIDGTIVDSAGGRHDVHVGFDLSLAEKRVSINRVQLGKLNELIGQFPVVVLSPESVRITSGSPGERRKFIDMVLAQESRSYLEDLLEYRKVLRQRNRLLFETKSGGPADRGTIDPWTESLAMLGGRLIYRRKKFVSSFRDVLSRFHRILSGNDEETEVEYRTVRGVTTDDRPQEVSGRMMDALRAAWRDEYRRGTTLIGPHRDDLLMSINGLTVQEHASQGQHKTLLLAMKIAEFEHMRETVGEVPVLLLDDLFGELDEKRSRTIIDIVSGLGQSIITTTDDRLFEQRLNGNTDNRRFRVRNGKCMVG